jgi:hypothetical protein
VKIPTTLSLAEEVDGVHRRGERVKLLFKENYKIHLLEKSIPKRFLTRIRNIQEN